MPLDACAVSPGMVALAGIAVGSRARSRRDDGVQPCDPGRARVGRARTPAARRRVRHAVAKERSPARAARGDGRGDADRRDRRRNGGRDTWTFRCRPRAESAEELARLLCAVPSSDQRRLALASDGRASFERLLREGDSQPGRVMYR